MLIRAKGRLRRHMAEDAVSVPVPDRIAKITFPRAGRIQPRDGIVTLLASAEDTPCTWVVGPPGAGKTSAVLSSLSAKRGSVLWYQVDEGDSDPAAFFHYLTLAAARAEAVANVRLPPFSPDANFSVSGFARRFFRELMSAEGGLQIVLDNYQDVPSDAPLHDIIRVACEEAPLGCRLVVISREDPPAEFARLRANGAISFIRWEHLRLTEREVAEFAHMHGVGLRDHEAAMWHQYCDGWAAGLRLLIEEAGSKSLPVLRDSKSSTIFAYFSGEFFLALPADWQNTLAVSALPRKINFQILNALGESHTCLEDLAKRNYFTTYLNEPAGWYQFHPLFREFLLERSAKTCTKNQLQVLRIKLAALFEACNELDDAAALLCDAQATAEYAGFICRNAPHLEMQHRLHTLALWIGALSAETRSENPWLHYWLGVSHMYQKPESSRKTFEIAFHQFAENGDIAGRLLAWSGVVDSIFNIYSNLADLDPWIEELGRILGPNSDFPTPMIAARVSFSMLVALSFRQPQHADLPAWATRLRGLLNAIPNPAFVSLARLYLAVNLIWSGQLKAARAELDHVKSIIRKSGAPPIVEITLRLVTSTYCVHSGDVQEGLAAVREGISAATESGIHIWDRIFFGQAATLSANSGDREGAWQHLRCMQEFLAPERAIDQSFSRFISASVCWNSGERDAALAEIRLALPFAVQGGLPYFECLYFMASAMMEWEVGDRNLAVEQLEHSRDIGRAIRNPMIEWMVRFMQSHFCSSCDDTAAGDQWLSQAMELGSSVGFTHFFFWPREVLSRLCLRALQCKIAPAYAHALIRENRLLPPRNTAACDDWPWALKVYTLGRFAVLVDGKEIRFSGKAQRVPMTLLKALIAFGGRDVSESRLVDALWPDSEGDAGAQALTTSLFRLRKLVGQTSIIRQGGKLTLDSANCWVDCWALERRMTEARNDESSSLRNDLPRLYQGSFLNGDDQSPWILPIRERLHGRIVEAVCMLAKEDEARGDDESALRLYSFGLSVEEISEEFYRGVMRCYLRDGRRTDAIRAYRRCQKVLANYAGISPDNETTRLFLLAVTRSSAI